MGLFANSASPLDPHIDRATSDKNTSDDWSVILDVCDRVKEYSEGPKDCIKSLTKKLSNDNPRVALQAVTLLDACVNNCGRSFLLEVASREFEHELRKIITAHRTHSKVSEKLRKCLKTWSEGEFKDDRQLSLIPCLYNKLRQEGYEFDASSDTPKKKKAEYSTDPNVVNNKQEEDDIAQAIQLSLQTAKSGSNNYGSGSNGGNSNSNRSLYPSDLARDLDSGLSLSDSKGPASNASAPAGQVPSTDQIKKARALYDFEAVEDNELTFQAGELIVVIDSSDPNWWKGSNHRGEGLFPANFVTLDIHGDSDNQPSRNEKRVSFSECVKVTEVVGGGEEEEQEGGQRAAEPCAVEATGEVDEEKIDYLMHMLHEADPTGERPDDPQLPSIEKQAAAMAPTIDAELEQIDRKHNELTRLNADLITGLNLYHQLMREMPVSSMGYYPPPVPYGAPMPHAMDPATGQMMPQPPHQVPGYSPYGSMPVMGCPPMGSYPPMGMPLPQHMGSPGMGPAHMAQGGLPSHNGIVGPPPMTDASSVAGGGHMALPPPQQQQQPPVSSMAPNGSVGGPVPSSQGAPLYHQTQAPMPSQDHVSDSSSNTCVSSSNGGVLPSYGHYPPVSDLQQHPPPPPLQQQQPQFVPSQQQQTYHMMSPQHPPSMYGHPYSGSPVPHSMSPAVSVAPPPQQAYQQPLL